MSSSTNRNDSVLLKCLAGAIGGGVSGLVTNPMDVIKIKNQQYGGASFGTFTGTARVLLQQEGLRGFFKGAASSVLREVTYGSLRMGFYEPIKEGLTKLTSQDVNSPIMKWSSAFLSGAVCSGIFTPIDLVKVRFQSQLPGQPKPYTSIWNAFSTIYREEHGFRGLYNGAAPTVIRAALLTCAQLGSYDVIKNNLLVQRLGLGHEDITTHFAAALIASIVTATAANPPDVVRTRAMNDKTTTETSKTFAHFQTILRQDGLSGFMKGWTASYLRLGPYTIISFLLIERVRQLLGMTTY
jgi:hypothetical protein